MEIRRGLHGFEIAPEAWAADRPQTSIRDARSWAELADHCEAVAAWCVMVLETRQLDSHDRDMVRIEYDNMAESALVYRHWAALRRPFRGRT